MSKTDEYTIIPFTKHFKESKPRLFLQKRPNFSPEIKITLSALGEIGANDYVEMYMNESKTKIKLVPVKKPTVYARSVTTDAIAWGRIGGANMLIELGYKTGIYEMEANLEFKYKTANSKPKAPKGTADGGTHAK